MSAPVNNNATIISQVGQYIYDHSSEPINLDSLANYTGFSKYHFNRLFFAATGFQLGEYIQRQKLEKALHIIKSGNHNLLDVALCVGYESPSSFTRAFKKMFSITPSDVVQGKHPYNSRAGTLPPKKTSLEFELQPQWQTLPSRTIWGLYGNGFTEQSFSKLAGQLYGQLASMAADLNYAELQPIGVSIDNPWVGEQSQSQFFAGFVNGLSDHIDDLERFEWQGGTWACFTHFGPHNTMWQTISQVYAQWVLPNGVKLKDQHIVQIYKNNPLETPPEQVETQLCFAVEDNH